MSKKFLTFSTIIMMSIFMTAITVSAAQVHLKWDASSGTVTGYRIYYGNNPGSHPNKVEVGNVTDYVVSNLELDKAYFFVVRAFNSYGESGPSNEVSWPKITVDAIPNPASNPKTDISFAVHIDPSPQNTVSYKWDFKDGSPLQETTSSSISHSFNTPKEYPVDLSINFSSGTSLSKTINTKVNDLIPSAPSKPTVN